MSRYNELLGHSIFDTRADHLEFPDPEQIRLTYERARLVCRASGITVEDVVKLRPNFWDVYRDPIMGRDSAVATILSIHWNLCIGTIGTFAHLRPDLAPLLEKLIRFDLCGEFMLTEVGHGLDTRNLETTATLQPDGSFDLHSPRTAAAKAMPPTTPWAGIGRVGIVFARLIVHEEDRGVKAFIVHLNDENEMCPGITSQPLPKRSGTKALDHAITTFTHVRLGPDSLLGSPARARDQRTEFMRQIHRVPIGTLSLSITHIPVFQQSALIAGTYSLRRHVAADLNNQRTPIIQFSTQYRPILDAIAQGLAYDAFVTEAIAMFLDSKLSGEVRHAVAVCFKTSVSTDAQITLNELADRCGWQGLFEYNKIIETAMAIRGNGIAEGDYTVLCIRLVSEVLRGRYKLPEARMKTCQLARHEAGVWQEAREMVESLLDKEHRGEEFNAHLLPRCRELVRATGHRMAYEAAAINDKITPEALKLFESICIKTDLSWYCQFEGLSRNTFLARDGKTAREALPLLKAFLSQDKPPGVAMAPIMYEESWNEFIRDLPMFGAGKATSLRNGCHITA
ncbi:putative acyl-CoA oxidase [Xylariaceae sp. AK1471]|nr:putative acyl-CoA oxidase [Xylariaceae sp. AK1471]